MGRSARHRARCPTGSEDILSHQAGSTGEPPFATGPMGTTPHGEQGDQPGVGDALRRVRDSGRRLADAHIELLKAELAVAGRQLGIVIGMAVAIFALATVAGLLLVIGTCLFLGEWLFGSMAWGIVHGVLFFVALIVPLALDLAGGRRDAFARGLAAGLVTTLLLWALFASNVLRDTAVNVGRSLEPSLAIEPAFLPTLVGLVAGMVLLGVAGLVLGWRRGAVAGPLVLGLVVGAAVGAILGSVTFDTKGALAVALVVGLVTWMGVTVLVAVRSGFDPEGRYEAMVPRETMAMAQETKEFLERQWRRQRGKVLGR